LGDPFEILIKTKTTTKNSFLPVTPNTYY